MIKVTDGTFEKEVLDSEDLILVDFWAEWCGPCKALGKTLEILEKEGQPFKIAKLDVDENPGVTMRYEVTGIPTVMLFRNGEVVERVTGSAPKEILLRKLSPHF